MPITGSPPQLRGLSTPDSPSRSRTPRARAVSPFGQRDRDASVSSVGSAATPVPQLFAHHPSSPGPSGSPGAARAKQSSISRTSSAKSTQRTSSPSAVNITETPRIASPGSASLPRGQLGKPGKGSSSSLGLAEKKLSSSSLSRKQSSKSFDSICSEDSSLPSPSLGIQRDTDAASSIAASRTPSDASNAPLIYRRISATPPPPEPPQQAAKPTSGVVVTQIHSASKQRSISPQPQPRRPHARTVSEQQAMPLHHAPLNQSPITSVCPISLGSNCETM